MTLPPYTIGLQLSFARMEKDLDEEFEELLGSKIPIPNEGDRLTRFRDSKMAARWQNVSSITMQRWCCASWKKKKRRIEPWPIWKGGKTPMTDQERTLTCLFGSRWTRMDRETTAARTTIAPMWWRKNGWHVRKDGMENGNCCWFLLLLLLLLTYYYYYFFHSVKSWITC